ncbi:flavin reductase family protein [Phycisphaera mikurensis]|uniref:Putative flavin reductase n=1 Tax=Phycisphaera mikurensis (strain NBRC 102666 / KCTC 22515 / FYK2301M01) TaxID=1142394 RepID=I0II50_PHYMF|nr:flavin reductase family protein [Phycisphaera mikurensis]MBB6442499.1 flavin reductase (DIM6/NTAB) family NADH-FMN oxidoreductase RutF [Phycisphaera mikurensis]BAM04938.1 putative flavin reductase [Phycisphaera mikurensis NBRC 102666]
MNVDFNGLASKERYKLLSSFVVPRPIALVTSLGEAGVVNAAPYSFFNCFGSDPGLVILNVGDRPEDDHGGVAKDTARNAERHGFFVVNAVDAGMAERMNGCAASFPPGESEAEAVGFTLAACPGTDVPRIAEAPASFACRTHRVEAIGGNRLVLGEVLHGSFREGLVDPESWRVDPDAFTPLGRLGGAGGYTRCGDRLEMKRPSVEEARRLGSGGAPTA